MRFKPKTKIPYLEIHQGSKMEPKNGTKELFFNTKKLLDFLGFEIYRVR